MPARSSVPIAAPRGSASFLRTVSSPISNAARCNEEYELKAQKGRFGAKVLDGAYGAKLQRLASANNPNLLLMNYDASV